MPSIRLAGGTDLALWQEWADSDALALTRVTGRDPCKPSLVFLIESPAGCGAPCGAVELFNIDGANRRAELGLYLADPSRRGRGLGVWSARRVVEASFAIGLHRLEAHILKENPAALSLARRAGFRVEGTCRGAVWRDGVPRDVVLLAMLPSDFLQRFGRFPRLSSAHAPVAREVAMALLLSLGDPERGDH
ncbi:MAG TPA: GNAT family protein [Limnochordia bacterium]